MPLVAHTNLPTFDRLRQGGYDILSLDRAMSQDIRELHIGLLNMMPDAALTVTEQQYMRLVGNCNQIAQFYIHPFSVPGLPRSAEATAYIDTYYAEFEDLREVGLERPDHFRRQRHPALIGTGAVLDAAAGGHRLGDGQRDEHPVLVPGHPRTGQAIVSDRPAQTVAQAVGGVQPPRAQPRAPAAAGHQHALRRAALALNEVTHDELTAAGLRVLVDSDEAGVHMAVSPDQFRIVYFQGHPEYDYNSLLKEYKREVSRYLDDEVDVAPPGPEHYFSTQAADLAAAHLRQAALAKAHGEPLPDFPEAALEPHLDNTWGDTGKAIFNNWLGLVYRLTHPDRRLPSCRTSTPRSARPEELPILIFHSRL